MKWIILGILGLSFLYIGFSWFFMDGRIFTTNIRNFESKQEAAQQGFLVRKKCYIQIDNTALYEELMNDSIWITKFEFSKYIGMFAIKYKSEIDTNCYVIHINHNHDCQSQLYKDNIYEQYYSEWCNPFSFKINKGYKKLYCAIKDTTTGGIKYLGYLRFEFTNNNEKGERTITVN